MSHADDVNDLADWVRLARYFSGLATSTEAREIEKWAQATPNRAREIALLRAAWDSAAEYPIERRAAAALPRVAARIGLPLATMASEMSESPELRPKHAQVRSKLAAGGPNSPAARSRRSALSARITAGLGGRHRPFVAATQVAAVLVIGFASMLVWRHSTSTRSHDHEQSNPMREYATHAAQRAEVRLSDGTRVILAASSHLRVPGDFGGTSRVVYLDGRAYFVVAHNGKQPFLVRTLRTSTEDIGTAFVVRAYPTDTVTEVVITEGRVALHPTKGGAGAGIALSRGQLARVDSSGLVSLENDVDLGRYMAWTQGRLVFHKTPLADVRRELEQWYDVEIALPDTLARLPVTAAFGNESVDEALGALGQLLDLRYSRSGRLARFTLTHERR